MDATDRDLEAARDALEAEGCPNCRRLGLASSMRVVAMPTGGQGLPPGLPDNWALCDECGHLLAFRLDQRRAVTGVRPLGGREAALLLASDGEAARHRRDVLMRRWSVGGPKHAQR